MAKQLVLPRVHLMVICDDVVTHDDDEDVFDLMGVRSELHASTFPYTHEQMVVYLQAAGHAGRAFLQVRIEEAATENVILATPLKEGEFRDPLAFAAMAFRLGTCVFPRPGLYYVQVYHESKVIGERPFRLLQSTEFGNEQ